MPLLDLEKLAASLGKGNASVVDSLGMSFGIPTCLMDLAGNLGSLALEAAFGVLPSNALGGLDTALEEGKLAAQSAIAEAINEGFLENGLIEYDTESGKLIFKSAESKNNLGNSESFLSEVFEFTGSALGIGAEIYKFGEGIQDQINDLKQCFDNLNPSFKFSTGNSAALIAGTAEDVAAGLADYSVSDLPTTQADVESGYAATKQASNQALNFVKLTGLMQIAIARILQAREVDPSLEPEFASNSVIDFPSDLGFKLFVSGVPDVEEKAPFFDLVFGPPRSTKGQFLLARDGFYYDYTSAINVDVPLIHGEHLPDDAKKWLFDYNPNLGGKGDQISLKDLSNFVDTLFDPDVIDDSISFKDYYDEDMFLQVLKDQRDKQILDLSGEAKSIGSASGEDSAIAVNMRQSIYSIIASHESKINRRKKQIEVAVKAPSLYAGDTTTPIPSPGEVPINDFSYLSQLNLPVALKKQKNLIFRADEVSGIVLPIKPKFVVAPDSTTSFKLSHLLVPPVGKGGIITSTSGLTSSGVTHLSLSDHIETGDLLAVYNFLNSNIAKSTDSNKFLVTDSAGDSTRTNAQLVGKDSSSVFVSGLGIPLLRGIGEYASTYPGGDDTNSGGWLVSGIGSYVRLPDTSEFQNLTYNPKGFSIDAWVHVPELNNKFSQLGWEDYGVCSFHKILLSCENTGGSISGVDYNMQTPKFDAEHVRGMLIGFTRDRQITQNTTPSNLSSLNDLGAGVGTAGALNNHVSFYMAPTQSVNMSGVTFVNSTEGDQFCADGSSYHAMKIDTSTTVNGVTFGDVSSNFMHIVVTVDPYQDKIQFILDGNLMATSSVKTTFGTSKGAPIQVPSFHKGNSFNYFEHEPLTHTKLYEGPKLNSNFTPWIIGGGYTDGMNIDKPSIGGFMGDHHGLRSGLGGYVGSFKIYGKPLTIKEAKKNFDAQKTFFKNIKIELK